jgi:hypothetical protein
MSASAQRTRLAAQRVRCELELFDLPPHEMMFVLQVVVTAAIAAYAGPDREQRRLMAALWCETLRAMVAEMPAEAG